MTVDHDSPNFCPDFRGRLQTFLDGNRDALGLDGETHRATCASCRGLFQAAVLVRQSIEQRGSIAVPADLTERLVRAVLAERTTATGLGWRMAKVLVAIATAACVLVVVFLASQRWRVKHPQGGAPATPEPV